MNHQRCETRIRRVNLAKSLVRPAALLAACALSAASFAGDGAPPGTSDLEIVVTGVASARGQLRVALFSPDEASLFPDGLPRLKLRVPANGQAVSVVFRGVPYGAYSVAAFHDENRNDLLDRNVFGVPRERWGVTGTRPAFRAPRYSESAVTLNAPHQRLAINLE